MGKHGGQLPASAFSEDVDDTSKAGVAVFPIDLKATFSAVSVS